MPVYQFEAMDAAGQEIRDEIDAANEEEAQTTIRQMGYFVTKISVKKQAASAAGQAGKKRGFAIGKVKTKQICAFTRQLSILQGRRFAHFAESENSRKQPERWQTQICTDGCLRRN